MKDYDVSKDIYRLNNLIQSRLTRLLKGYNITHLEARLLLVISDLSDLNQDQLAMELNITKNVVTQKLTNLYEHGLIERSENKKDRRHKEIFLTNKGELTCLSMKKEINQYNEILFNSISDFNIKMIEQNLKIMQGNAKKNK